MNAQERLAKTEAILSKKRVLIVEDVDNARATYCTELQKADFVVDGARNLEEALKKLEERTYHVAAVDIMLAGEDDRDNRDGLTVLSKIKDSRREVRSSSGRVVMMGTRSIALTGQDEPQLAAELVSQYGANDYIDKHKFLSSLTDELIKKVRRQVAEGQISLYGDKNVISFLVGSANELSWVDRSLRTLKVKGGYAGLERFFSALCNPIAPLVALKDAQASAEVNEEIAVVFGKLWSKALAVPVLLIAAHEDMSTDQLRSKIPDLDPDTLLTQYSGEGLTGLVLELKNYSRVAFKAQAA